MDFASFVIIISKVTIGGIGTFFAVLLWSKTRDAAWIFVILGVIVEYIAIIYSTLEMFGVVGNNIITFYEIPVLKLLLAVLPMLFFIFAFITVIARKKIPK
ncbi:MAG: hypothetical protein J7K04_07565 [Spirochaetales bacterium]|nr:hypothetical protein [Spirochaetales bacterium]